uniref:Spexin n=1 Tax=Lygus hesperus TaxID=30085 RepID=A0A0A9ZEU1_LYGHE
MKLVLYFMYSFVMLCNRAISAQQEQFNWVPQDPLDPEYRLIVHLAVENVRHTGQHRPDRPYEPVGDIYFANTASVGGANWFKFAYEVPAFGNSCFALFNIKGATSWKSVHIQEFSCRNERKIG